MGLQSYLVGCCLLVLAITPVAWAAFRWRARLVPRWRGGPARIVEVVLACALFFAVLHVLGIVGAFRRWPVVIALAVVGTITALVAGRSARPVDDTPGDAAPPSVSEAAVGALIVAIVVAFWTPALRDSLLAGPVEIDTQSFHLPMAVRFMQEGRLTGLAYMTADYHFPYYPYEVDLVHAFGALVFGRDVLTPVLNFGWLAALLGAAWTAGRRHGVAVATLAAGAVVVTTANMKGTQPGAATTDTAGVFFLMAAIVVLIHVDERRPASVAIAAAAAGMAIATKQAFIIPSAVLTLAVLFDAWKRRRASVAWAWIAPLVVTGGFWYVRNLAHTGTPVPGLPIRIGPIDLSGPPMRLLDILGDPFVKYVFDAEVWRTWYLPQLRENLGVVWPLLLGLPFIACLFALIKGRDRMLRGVALSGLAIFVVYVFTPTTAGGPERQPVLFGPTLRYLAPAVLIGAILAVRSYGEAQSRIRPWLGWFGLGFLILTASTTRITPGRAGVAVAVLVAVCCAVVFAIARGPARPGVLIAAGGILAVAVGAVGYLAQDAYLQRRYTPSGNYSSFWPEFDELASHMQPVRGARIGVTAAGAQFNPQYPLAGADLTNEIDYIGVKKPSGEFTEHSSCGAWRDAINAGDYDYVVVQHPLAGAQAPPFVRWIQGDPAIELVIEDEGVSLFEVAGTLDPQACVDDD